MSGKNNPFLSSPSQQLKDKNKFWKIGFFIELLVVFITGFLSLSFALKLADKEEKLVILRQQLKVVNDRKNTVGKEEKAFKPLQINSWKKFSEPDFSFSFQYPADWLVEKPDPQGTVSVANHLDSCQNCSFNEKQNYYQFYIQSKGRLEEGEKTKSALEYLLKNWLAFVEKEVEECQSLKEQGLSCLPTVPGFTQRYIGEADRLFNNQKITVVEVSPYHYAPDYGEDFSLIQNEYLLIDDSYNLYLINLISPGYSNEQNKPDIEDSSNPLIRIIKTLQFF